MMLHKAPFLPLLILCLWILSLDLQAQYTRKQVLDSLTFREGSTFQTGVDSTQEVWYSEVLHINSPISTPIYTFYLVWEKEDELYWEVQFISGSSVSQTWAPLAQHHHTEPLANKRLSELFFLDTTVSAFQIRATYLKSNKEQLVNQKLKIRQYFPGHTPPVLPGANPKRSICECEQPAYQDRNDWCPNGNCPESTNPTFTLVTHLIVHHSAGSNASSDWGAVVRSIWDFHVNGNGWADIGYNWLISPEGEIFQGRADNVLGAHFCGRNSRTMGVCMMGTYNNLNISPNARESLIELLGWKSCTADLDPAARTLHTGSGLMLNTISGHRDGCSTACPGDSLWSYLPELRLAVKHYQQLCVTVNAPTSLSATAVRPEKVQLNWTDASDNETMFIVERAEGTPGIFNEIIQLPPNTTSYIDSTVQAGRSYYYRVRALGANQNSGYSNIATATTLAAKDGSQACEWQLYPNPVYNSIYLECLENTGRIIVRIQEIASGRLQSQFEFDPTTFLIIDVQHYQPGAYQLQIIEKGRVVTRSFLKH